MVVDAVDSDAAQALGKFGQRMSDESGWNDNRFRGTEIKSFAGHARPGGRNSLKKILDDLDKACAQAGHRSKFANVDTGQAFGEAGLITGRERPVRKVVGESFADKVMFLQGSKTVLEDGGLGTLAQVAEKVRKSSGFLPRNTKKVRGGIEIKRLHRSASVHGCQRGAAHTFTAKEFSGKHSSPSQAWSQRSSMSRTSPGGLSQTAAAVAR